MVERRPEPLILWDFRPGVAGKPLGYCVQMRVVGRPAGGSTERCCVDDAAAEGDENAIPGSRRNELPAGEGAEGGQDEAMFREVEAREAEGAATTVLDAHHGMEMAADGEPARRRIGGIVDDPGRAQLQRLDAPHRSLPQSAGAVVIADDQGDAIRMEAQPGVEAGTGTAR